MVKVTIYFNTTDTLWNVATLHGLHFSHPEELKNTFKSMKYLICHPPLHPIYSFFMKNVVTTWYNSFLTIHNIFVSYLHIGNMSTTHPTKLSALSANTNMQPIATRAIPTHRVWQKFSLMIYDTISLQSVLNPNQQAMNLRVLWNFKPIYIHLNITNNICSKLH